MPDIEVNTEWFESHLKRQGKSKRALSRELELDPSSVVRMLRGQRRMQLSEAKTIAQFVGVPLNEVLENAGLQEPTGPATLTIFSEVDGDGIVSTVERPTKVADYMSDAVFDVVARMDTAATYIGAVIKASSGPLALLDDALMIFSTENTITDRAVGTLAIIEPRGGDSKFLARIEKARKSGTMTVRKVDGNVVDIDVISATPIEFVRP